MGDQQPDGEIPPPLPAPATQPPRPLLLTPEAAIAPKETRADFERGMSYWPRFTLALIVINVINVIVFIAEIVTGALQSKESIIAAGALHRDSVLAGQGWRIITGIFMHGSFEHLLGNSVALYVLGVAAEHAYGATRYAIIYLVCGVGASIISIIAAPGPSLGASGAIFGLMSVILIFFYRFRKVLFLKDNRLGIVLLIWAAWQFITGALSPLVDNFAHLGGFLTGLAVGFAAPPRRGVLPAPSPSYP